MSTWSGKDYQGTFAGGEGPINGQSIKIEQENKGLIPGTAGGDGRSLKQVEGVVHGPQGSEDKPFSLNSPSYQPSDNYKTPTDKGTRNPFDLGQ